MEINDYTKVRGNVEIIITKANGEVIKDEGHNLVVDGGKAMITSILSGNSSILPVYMALGSGSTTPAGTDTALESELSVSGLTRTSATPVQATTTTTNDTMKYDVTFTALGTASVSEVGIFDAASSGNMLCRRVFSPKPIESGDTIEIIYSIVFA